MADENGPEPRPPTPNGWPCSPDWLIENVYFVEVTASADTDAYAIFETMNDRGLSLTPVDMLKSYLLVADR